MPGPRHADESGAILPGRRDQPEVRQAATNTPMARAFARAGYAITGERVFLAR